MRTVKRKVTATRRVAELHLLLQSVMIRRLKADVMSQLPPKRRQRILLDIPDVPSHGWSGSSPESGFPADMAQLEHAAKSVSSAKLTAVAEYLRCLLSVGGKFLLFAHHLHVLDELERVLTAEAVQYIRIDGSTPMSARTQVVGRFQEDNDIRVAVLSLTACSQGLTLTAASLVVFAELFWVPSVLLQAEDRAHRLGQTCSVNIHYLVARGTVDERMYQAAERRARENTDILDASVEAGACDQLHVSRGLQAPVASALEALAEVAKSGQPQGRSASQPLVSQDADDSDIELISTGATSLAWSGRHTLGGLKGSMV